MSDQAPLSPVTDAPAAPASPEAAPLAPADAPVAGKKRNKGGRKRKAAAAADAAATSAVAKSRGGFKDWLRVEKSQGSGLENEVVRVLINEQTKVLTLVTQARVKVDDPSLEAPRIQKMRFTEFVIDNTPEPVAAPEPVAPAPEPAPAQ